MFNPEEFLNSTVTGSNDTKLIPVPVAEYVAIVDSVKLRPWQSNKGPEAKSGYALDIMWKIDDFALQEQLGRTPTVKQGVMLEFNDAGALDMGKGRNVGLGRVREAVGLNDPAAPFAPSMLVGKMAKVKVKHRVDGQDIYAEVEATTKIG